MKLVVLEVFTRDEVWNKARSCDPCYLVGLAGELSHQSLNYRVSSKPAWVTQ